MADARCLDVDACLRAPIVLEIPPSKYTNVTMDWRLNHLGRLDSAAARMFNRLEAAWFKTPFYVKNYVMCDQLGCNSTDI